MLNTLMNVRQQSGRRRGRGGQNRPGGGNGRGPESGNRIDNRARGNAPQLLEKYKGLARDAQQAGDRVLMEYYLQFADHYFRVVSESRTRADEQRQPRGEGQSGGDGYDGDDGQDGQDDSEDDFGFKLPPRQEQPRPQQQPREDRPQQQQREDRGQREDRPRNDQQRGEQQRNERNERSDQAREDRPRQEQRPREDRAYNGNGGESYQPQQQRGPQQPRFAEEAEEAPRRRELPPRRERTPRAEDGGPASFDASVLPPAIGSSVSEAPGDSLGGLPMGMEGEPIDLPVPKKRGRPRKDAAATPASDT